MCTNPKVNQYPGHSEQVLEMLTLALSFILCTLRFALTLTPLMVANRIAFILHCPWVHDMRGDGYPAKCQGQDYASIETKDSQSGCVWPQWMEWERDWLWV